MKMKFFVIIFASFAIETYGRSFTPSNVRDSDEKISAITSEQLKELIESYEENFGKLINFAIKICTKKDNNQREIQFLKQLRSLIEQLDQEQLREHVNLDNDTDSTLQALSNSLTKNFNNVNDLFNAIKVIDITYQDGEITDEHVRIKRAAKGNKRVATFATSAEQMTNILINIQRQVVQIRKYLDVLCKKHYSTSTTILEANPDDDISPVD